MKNSQFEAKTFGVGELISQRKLFRVPPHQRSYAWDKASVDEFLLDIETAHANGASDYFIGLDPLPQFEASNAATISALIQAMLQVDSAQRLSAVELLDRWSGTFSEVISDAQRLEGRAFW